jgi:autotransporter-associated beta strand protein
MSLRQVRACAVLKPHDSSSSLACSIRLTGAVRFATRIAFSIMLPLLFGMDQQSAAAGTNGTWTGTVSGGLWSNSLNWLNSVVADGVDSSADFSALDITSDLSIGLDSARTIGNLYFGDTWPSNNWTLGNNGNSANVLTMAVSGGAPTIAVVNQATSISAVLSGTSGFTKTGVGSLALSATAANTFSGVTTSARRARSGPAVWSCMLAVKSSAMGPLFPSP